MLLCFLPACPSSSLSRARPASPWRPWSSPSPATLSPCSLPRCLPSSSSPLDAAFAPPPLLPTLLCTRRGRPRAERRRREERRGWGAWPWEERSSTRPRASGAARADRAARTAGSSPLDTYPFVSFYHHCLGIRGHAVDTYPGRIPGVSVSDTYPTRDTPLPCRIHVSEVYTC